MVKKILLALACLTLMTISSHASATNIYISQNGAGAANGADCADARPVSFFNASGNWGSGSAQIGPGTTVHLCGTFSGGANSTMLTIQGSGANGSPITIYFESGAQMTAPYWNQNGAITCSNQNYITVDGGQNGLIQNTQAGTGLAYQDANSAGILLESCSHTEIRNLNIQNIYQRSGNGSDGNSTAGINYEGSSDFISIHNNTITNASAAIFVGFNSVTSANIYNNVTDYNKWSIALLDDNSGSTASGVNVYGNQCGPHFDIWADTGFGLHLDGIFLSAQNSNSRFVNSSVYNNYVHGDMGASGDPNGTAYLYLSGAAGGMSGIAVFNNIFSHESSSGAPEANIVIGGSGGVMPSAVSLYNNTLTSVGHQSNGIRMRDGMGSGIVIKNNIFSGLSYGIDLFPNSAAMIAASDHNLFYNLNNVADTNAGSGPPQNYTTLANWQSASAKDANSSSANPILTVSLAVQTSSPAVNLGANLTGLGIAALNSDKNGTPRPISGAWTAGAYQSGTSTNTPAPPSSLTAIVQ